MSPNKENKPDPAPKPLRELQLEFAAHIRNPEKNPAPAGLEDRRMKIYRDLFFNNIQSLLASNFPVLRRLHDDASWRALIRDFYSRHRSKTPLFPEVAKEFLQFLQDERGTQESDPPFLLELAHYEWVELALEVDERELDEVRGDRDGDLLTDTPVLSPLAWPLSYRFPVHRIRPDFQPREAPEEQTHLLVWRNRDHDVKFMQLNPVARLLLQLMQENPGMTGERLLERVAVAISHPQPGKVMASGEGLLHDWNDKNILLGARRVD
jgi:hypothetical protein